MPAWHIITCEYPPQIGGVSDYVPIVAGGLAACGDEVHVWAPLVAGTAHVPPGVALHRDLGSFVARDLQRTGRALDAFPGPRRLFVQWVPHGYARDSVNLTFCWWLLWRARVKKDRVELMVHEPFLPFAKGALRQNVAALAHRVMTTILLAGASRVWYAIPAWEERWRPYRFGRNVPSGWLPLPSTIPLDVDAGTTARTRERYADPGSQLLGHFGTFGREIRRMVLNALVAMPTSLHDYTILLLGPGGESVRDELIAARPDLSGRVHATGGVPAAEVTPFIAACDVMLQPYPDGVTSRRTSFMACIGLGRPTVTTVGELSERFWTESGAAVLTRPTDTVAMVEETARLLTDRTARARIGECAKRFYVDRFQPSRIVDALRRAAVVVR